MAIIEVKELVPGYSGKGVCAPITFSLEKGDYLCVLGENGSGKSTLIKTLLGLQKPVSGSFSVSAGGIGYLPQQDEASRDFPASVEEVVLSGCSRSLFPKKADKERAFAAMERLGVEHLSKKSYRELSGGQQQRVLLSRALCAADEILLLDEPAAALDAHSVRGMYDAVKYLNDQGLTVLMISHDPHAVLRDATHVLHVGTDSARFVTKEEYTEGNNG